MPARKRHQPGKYKQKPAPLPNFSGIKPLTIFQGDDGLWGAKDGEGNIEIAPIYQRAEQTESERLKGVVRLVTYDHVIKVSSEDWDLLSFISPD